MRAYTPIDTITREISWAWDEKEHRSTCAFLWHAWCSTWSHGRNRIWSCVCSNLLREWPVSSESMFVTALRRTKLLLFFFFLKKIIDLYKDACAIVKKLGGYKRFNFLTSQFWTAALCTNKEPFFQLSCLGLNAIKRDLKNNLPTSGMDQITGYSSRHWAQV